MSPVDILLWVLNSLSGAVLLVLMLALFVVTLRAICDCCAQPPPAQEGVERRQQQRLFPAVGIPPPTTLAVEVPPALVVAPPAPVPPPVVLPYFPYASRGGRSASGGQASETVVVCAICLDPLRHGQPCSEVPACRHTFHRDCVGSWARRSNSCPLCRVKIVLPRFAATTDDMV